MMRTLDGFLLAIQRRVIGTVAAVLAAKWGIELEADALGKLWMAAFGFVTACGYLWSYLVRIDRRELYRRLWPAVFAAVGAACAALGVEVPKEALENVHVQGAALVAVVSGVLSFALERKRLVPKGRLASPNP